METSWVSEKVYTTEFRDSFGTWLVSFLKKMLGHVSLKSTRGPLKVVTGCTY